MALAVALAFGGRKVTGIGFGIPLVIRYVLETCSNVEEACIVLTAHTRYTWGTTSQWWTRVVITRRCT